MCSMSGRDTPVVEVSNDDLQEYSDVQLGSRVLAALAHTPAEGFGNYHAIVVVADREAADWTAEEAVDADYDSIIKHKIKHDDDWRAKVGGIVRDKMQKQDTFVLGRS